MHDELVVEAAEDVAEEVERRMIDAMTQAFREFFPAAPYVGLVETKIAKAWGEVK